MNHVEDARRFAHEAMMALAELRTRASKGVVTTPEELNGVLQLARLAELHAGMALRAQDCAQRRSHLG